MRISDLQKGKYGKSNEISQDSCDEGTSARTRPISFDEIMLKRKHNKLPENVTEGAIETGHVSKVDVIENVSVNFESKRSSHDKDSTTSIQKRTEVEYAKVSSRKKEETASVKEDHIVREKSRRRHEAETKVKDKTSKDVENKANAEKSDKHVHRRRKVDEQSRDDHGREFEKRHSRDSVGKDRYTDKKKGNTERESKRKDRNGEDQKIRDKNIAKKHNPSKWHDFETSERKERKESSKSHFEESRPKRRRSRSREHEDRNRRSTSPSPKAHKHTSYYGRGHGELPSHSVKDRSGRQHSDIDRGHISSNGLSTSHYRRHGASTSGLGGYSPRKRKSEAAVKTPSPTVRSPEKRSAGWDLLPARRDSTLSGSDPPNFHLLNQPVSSIVQGLASSSPVASSIMKPLPGVTPNALSTKKNPSGSVDSVQLTQATRPMRRLRVENLPPSASEKVVMECINKFFLSSGVNHIQGTQPCISCTIHTEKGQAIVEFLTPEDASAALSFDGISFSGSILKISRPKDFSEVATGDLDKSVAAVDTISDIVKDTPHKIFVGGISKALSSKMVMEIVSAFGPLKAYHLEVYEDQPCAFLEYVDHVVTLKACAGLNGMKVGGQVLTVVQAVPNASPLENTGDPPFYGIPEHAKSLLEQPTPVLKLQNVFNPETLASLTELEVEEVLEDVRLECARFGTVRSVNVVKSGDSQIPTSEVKEVAENSGPVETPRALWHADEDSTKETLEVAVEYELRTISDVEFLRNGREEDKYVEGNCIDNKKSANDLIEIELCQPNQPDWNIASENTACENTSGNNSQQLPDELNTLKDEAECQNDVVADAIEMQELVLERKSMAGDVLNTEEPKEISPEHLVGSDDSVARVSDAIQEDYNKEDIHIKNSFTPGCVFVEFGRTEASCAAAHCLHGRSFDDRIVTVEYVSHVSHDLYRARFPK